MNYPLVSIIIPVYKRKELACETLECVLKQDYPNYEIIIGDNCSPDGTFEFIQERYKHIPNIIIFQNSQNLGAARNWQQCLQRAKGKYVKFLWSDDLIEASYLQKTVSFLEKHSEIPFVMTSVKTFTHISEPEIVIDAKKENKRCCYQFGLFKIHRKRQVYRIGKTGVYPKKVFYDGIYKYVRFMPVSAACTLFRRNEIKIMQTIPNKLGFCHNTTGAGTDLRMFLDSFINYNYFGFIDEPLSYFRAHKDSITCKNNDIYDGYLTAKLDYLVTHKMNDYMRSMDADIIIKNQRKNIYSISDNYNIIKKYYDSIYTNGRFINGLFLIFTIWKICFLVYSRNICKFIGRINL